MSVAIGDGPPLPVLATNSILSLSLQPSYTSLVTYTMFLDRHWERHRQLIAATCIAEHA